jgi:tRNA/rRNA methyltransferase
MWNVRIVLVEPSGALNLGSVARVIKNMGLSQLWLVNPKCDRFSSEATQMAVHGQEILTNAQIVQTLPQALQGCQKVVATAGRIDVGELALISPAIGLNWLIEADQSSSAIVFGTEDRGLSNAELQYCQKIINIPTDPDYSSLNLAQAVAICCYHLQLLWQERSDRPSHPSQLASNLLELAAVESIEGFYQHFEQILLEIGYLYPHTSFSRMQRFRHLFNKAQLSKTEVTMLRGVLRQMQWHSNKSQT